MAKTKIDDLSKGAEKMDAEEQKAAKGGAGKLEKLGDYEPGGTATTQATPLILSHIKGRSFGNSP